MATVKITKTSHETDIDETFVMESNSFKNLRINLNSPMFVQDLPETSEEQTIVIKITGNTQRIHYTFPIVDLSGVNLVTSGIAADTSTVEGQMGFLLNEFRPISIKDTYLFETVNPQLISRECVLEDLDISFTENDPINPLCSMTFVVGQVTSLTNKGVPQEAPTGLTLGTSGSDITVTWTDVLDEDRGEGGAITGYKVERRSEIGSWTTLTSSGSSVYTDNTVSTGVQYKYRVSAVNAAGFGEHTTAKTQVAP